MQSFDLIPPKQKGKAKSLVTCALEALEPGHTVIHDHSGYATPFTVWLAQQRSRRGKQFRFEAVDKDDGLYRVFLTDTMADSPELLAVGSSAE